MWDPIERHGELGDDASPQEMLVAFVTQLRDSAQDLLLAGVELGLVIIGVMAQAGAIREMDGPLALGRVALLAALFGAEMRGMTLLALGHRWVFNAVSALRRVMAAPLLPGWETPFSPPPPPPSGELLQQVRALVCAVHHRCELMRRALFWSAAGVALFILWTLANLISGAAG